MADHIHDLVPYPTRLGDAGILVAQKLRGEAVDNECLVHAAYHVQGFAMGMFWPDSTVPPPKTTAADNRKLSNGEVAAILDECCEDEKKGNAAPKKALPWLAIVKLLVPLILQWITERTDPATA